MRTGLKRSINNINIMTMAFNNIDSVLNHIAKNMKNYSRNINEMTSA